ncbi:hypothetical protein B0H13DRAFT_1916809 [Mycena leptocephala]|nr:hypothetical protein B0H13DRAFT_1916809 [Mycena leptocephala]
MWPPPIFTVQHHEYPGISIPPAAHLSDLPTTASWADIAHHLFVQAAIFRFWVVGIFGSGHLTFGAFFVRETRNWMFGEGALQRDLREVLVQQANAMEDMQAQFIHEPLVHAEDFLDTLLSLENLLYFLSLHGVRVFVHPGIRLAQLELVGILFPEKPEKDLEHMLDSVHIVPDYLVRIPPPYEGFWNSIAVLPMDWEDPRAQWAPSNGLTNPRDWVIHIDGFLEFLDCFEYLYFTGFANAGFAEPDGGLEEEDLVFDVPAAILEGQELHEFMQSLDKPPHNVFGAEQAFLSPSPTSPTTQEDDDSIFFSLPDHKSTQNKPWMSHKRTRVDNASESSDEEIVHQDSTSSLPPPRRPPPTRPLTGPTPRYSRQLSSNHLPTSTREDFEMDTKLHSSSSPSQSMAGPSSSPLDSYTHSASQLGGDFSNIRSSSSEPPEFFSISFDMNPKNYGPDTLEGDVGALLEFYERHPLATRLEAHEYMEAVFRVVGNELRRCRHKAKKKKATSLGMQAGAHPAQTACPEAHALTLCPVKLMPLGGIECCLPRHNDTYSHYLAVDPLPSFYSASPLEGTPKWRVPPYNGGAVGGDNGIAVSQLQMFLGTKEIYTDYTSTKLAELVKQAYVLGLQQFVSPWDYKRQSRPIVQTGATEMEIICTPAMSPWENIVDELLSGLISLIYCDLSTITAMSTQRSCERTFVFIRVDHGLDSTAPRTHVAANLNVHCNTMMEKYADTHSTATNSMGLQWVASNLVAQSEQEQMWDTICAEIKSPYYKTGCSPANGTTKRTSPLTAALLLPAASADGIYKPEINLQQLSTADFKWLQTRPHHLASDYQLASTRATLPNEIWKVSKEFRYLVTKTEVASLWNPVDLNTGIGVSAMRLLQYTEAGGRQEILMSLQTMGPDVLSVILAQPSKLMLLRINDLYTSGKPADMLRSQLREQVPMRPIHGLCLQGLIPDITDYSTKFRFLPKSSNLTFGWHLSPGLEDVTLIGTFDPDVHFALPWQTLHYYGEVGTVRIGACVPGAHLAKMTSLRVLNLAGVHLPMSVSDRVQLERLEVLEFKVIWIDLASMVAPFDGLDCPALRELRVRGEAKWNLEHLLAPPESETMACLHASLCGFLKRSLMLCTLQLILVLPFTPSTLINIMRACTALEELDLPSYTQGIFDAHLFKMLQHDLSIAPGLRRMRFATSRAPPEETDGIADDATISNLIREVAAMHVQRPRFECLDLQHWKKDRIGEEWVETARSQWTTAAAWDCPVATSWNDQGWCMSAELRKALEELNSQQEWVLLSPAATSWDVDFELGWPDVPGNNPF